MNKFYTISWKDKNCPVHPMEDMDKDEVSRTFVNWHGTRPALDGFIQRLLKLRDKRIVEECVCD